MRGNTVKGICFIVPVGGKAPELFERLRSYLIDEFLTETA